LYAVNLFDMFNFQVHKNRNTLSFTTQELIQIDRRSKESLKEIVMLSNVWVWFLFDTFNQPVI
jgi:tRNA (Thr-GGU) A37 N-methylase